MAGKTGNGSGIASAIDDLAGLAKKQLDGADSLVGSAALTGFVEDVKRAKNSGDPNALLHLGLTMAAIWVGSGFLKGQDTKEISNGSK